MKSLSNNNIMHNLTGAISILFMAIIMHSCESDPIKGTEPSIIYPLASGITQTEAVLVAPVHYAESAYFEYGTNMTYGTKVSGGSCTVTVDHHCESWNAHAKLTGLNPGTTYYCRGVAKYKHKTSWSTGQTFTTLK
jgi:hypothetical protein